MPALQIPSVLFLPTSTLGTLLTNAAAGANLWYDSTGGSTGVVAKGSAGTIYGAYIDNTANGSTSPAYLKIAFTSTAPTVGTTNPNIEVVMAGAAQGIVALPTGTSGSTFSTALAYWVTTAGGTTSTSAPASAVPVVLAYL